MQAIDAELARRAGSQQQCAGTATTTGCFVTRAPATLTQIRRPRDCRAHGR
jgi:hypothetical protein